MAMGGGDGRGGFGGCAWLKKAAGLVGKTCHEIIAADCLVGRWK